MRASLIGALDGAAFTIPTSLGSATVVFSQIGLDLLPAGFLALLLSMIWVNATGALVNRPVVFSARFFEATTLAAMMGNFIHQLPSWGLTDTVGVRLASFCVLGAGAGLAAGLLYLLRADRFTRFIPAPVFAGFSNSIALALLVSQIRSIRELLVTATLPVVVLSIVAFVFATGFILRRLRPHWPGTAAALPVGLLLGLAWLALDHPTPVIGSFGWTFTVPLALADFGALTGPGTKGWAIALGLGSNAMILGAMMFINTTMATEFMSQQDGRRGTGPGGSLWAALSMTLGGLIGSVPVSGSTNASMIATRTTPLTRSLMALSAGVAALVYLSGIVGLIPLAAVCGALLCEAWFMVDRPSVAVFMDWLRRRTLRPNAKEDLALIAAVIASAMLVNMVAAIFVGLLLGLVLFAARNAKQPVGRIWTGRQLSSNCARSPQELDLLARHADTIRIFELEGDLFFGAADNLGRTLEQDSEGAAFAIIDWSRVRHVDSSVARSVSQFERQARARGVQPMHAATDAHAGQEEVHAVLHYQLAHGRFLPDLDRALEQAENELIRRHGTDLPPDVASMLEAASLFNGLDAQERELLEAVMKPRQFRAGQVMLAAGEPGDELMVLLQGAASVVLRSEHGKDVRLAGARRGAMLGDIAFLDRSSRSATVIAEQDTSVAVLRREDFDALSQNHPRLVQCLLSNIALTLAARLRHTNRLALARQSAR